MTRWRDIKRFCRYHGMPLPGAPLGEVHWPFDEWTTKHPESVRVVCVGSTGRKRRRRHPLWGQSVSPQKEE